jgi:hypothetical protein
MSDHEEIEILSGYVYRAMKSPGPLMRAAIVKDYLFPAAPFPVVDTQDCTIIGETVISKPGLGLSVIVENHLPDYFEDRWGEQEDGQYERVVEQKQAELDGARAKLETASKKEAKALPGQISRLETEIMRAKYRIIHLHKVFALVSVCQLRAMALAVFQNNNP